MRVLVKPMREVVEQEEWPSMGVAGILAASFAFIEIRGLSSTARSRKQP